VVYIYMDRFRLWLRSLASRRKTGGFGEPALESPS
jgi:hypothetical protein